MLLPILTAFSFFLVIAAVFNYVINKQGKQHARHLNDYLAAEHEANYTRKQPIDDAYYFTPNLSAYPIRVYMEEDQVRYADVIKKQAQFIQRSEQPMMQFRPKKTNYELKKLFGFPNLEYIITCEENWGRFFVALIAWGEALVAAGQIADAEQAFATAIEDGCDRTKAFTFLADIYHDRKDLDQLARLLLLSGQLEEYQQNKIRIYVNNSIRSVQPQ